MPSMSRLVFICFLVLSLFFPAFAQVPEHKPSDAKSADSNAEKPETKSDPKDYSDEGFVIVTKCLSVNHLGDNTFKVPGLGNSQQGRVVDPCSPFLQYVQAATRIGSGSGQHLKKLPFPDMK